MKKPVFLVVLILLLSISISSYGQQDPQYTQYMYNMNVINPAYAGSRGTLSINLLGRMQWVGIDGAPNTATLSVTSPIGEHMGLGGSIIHDEIGPVTETNLYGDFSYTINTSRTGRLAFGVKAGATLHNIDQNLQPQIDDPYLTEALAQGNQVLPNFGAGVYYYTDRFYVGLSVPNFLKSRYYEDVGNVVSEASEKMHGFGTVGVVFELSETVKLKPSALVKAAIGAPVSVDLSVNALFNEKFELGASYRLDDSVSAILGFHVNPDFRIGYAYDYTLSNLGDYNSGSHELMLLYDINRRDMKSPRFF